MMTRRLHRCVKCEPEGPTKRHPFTLRRGFTRHADHVCAACRKGIPTTAESEATLAMFRARGA